MNPIRRIVVHVTDSPRAVDTVRFAVSLAARHGAALTALYAVEPGELGTYLTAGALANAGGLAEDHRIAALSAAQRAAGTVPLEVARTDPFDALLHAARTADLLVMGQRNPDEPDGTPEWLAGRLLVAAGAPVLFVPYIGWDRAHANAVFPERVLVAWSDTRESHRALRDALPLLARAKEVEVIRFVTSSNGKEAAEPIDAAVSFLAQHDIRAHSAVRHASTPSLTERMRPGWLPDASVAEALLSRTADMGADLLVMGGYGHSRAWESAMGGVTRTLLESMTVPVLMSH